MEKKPRCNTGLNLNLPATLTSGGIALLSITPFAATTTMEPNPEVQALKAEIQELKGKNEGLERKNEELKEDIKALKRKNEEFEAENRGLRSRLPEIDGPEEKKDIRDHISANESKIIGNQGRITAIHGEITANQGTITANTTRITVLDTRITENQKTINATTPTEGTIPRHLSFHFLLSFPWIELLISTSFCKLNILWITITTKILIFLLASDF